MPLPKKLINFLEKSKVKFDILEHKTVYTAFDKSQTLKIKPNIVGKTLVLKADRGLVIALIPANKNIDKNKLKKVVNSYQKKKNKKAVKTIRFASERLIKNRLKDVKLGAVPPFGNLFGLPTFVNQSLLNKSKIIIDSGHYNRSIGIKGNFLKKLIPDLVTGSFVKLRK